jgi:hypothetical protein
MRSRVSGSRPALSFLQHHKRFLKQTAKRDVSPISNSVEPIDGLCARLEIDLLIASRSLDV